VSVAWPEARAQASECTARWAIESMSAPLEREFVRRGFDKRGWPRGPWDDEPDLVLFTTTTRPRMRCHVMRDADSGAWGGYVLVAKKHPLHGFDLNEERVRALKVFNGVSCAEHDLSTSSWCLGFTSHVHNDYCPGWKAQMLHAVTDIVRRADLGDLPNLAIPAVAVEAARRRLPELRLEISEIYDASRDTTPGRPRYHRYAFIREQTEYLAGQLAAMVKL